MPWRLVSSPRQFEWLKTEPGFATLVALGRCLNQLRFALHAVETAESDSPTFLARQMASGVFSIAAALYEGVELSRHQIGRYYAGYRQFDDLRVIWRGKENCAVLADAQRVRDNAVSHFLPDEVRRVMKTLSFSDECVFVMGDGDHSRDLHCRLSDGVALMTFAGECGTYDELVVRTNDLYKRLARLSVEFMAAADRLLANILTDYGFVLLEDDSATGDSE